MKCYIVSSGNPERFKCLPIVEENKWDAVFACDDLKQKNKLINLGVDKSSIVVCDHKNKKVLTNVGHIRDYLGRKIIPKNEWTLWLDDNVEYFTGLRPEYSTEKLDWDDKSVDWKTEFNHELSAKEVKTYLSETIDKAEELKTIYAGFSPTYNHYFRQNKWQLFVYVRTQFAAFKNDGLGWQPKDEDLQVITDGYKSVDIVARYGSVVVNRHLKPHKQAFQPGGIGSFKERLPHLQHAVQYLTQHYKGLVTEANSPTAGDQYGMPGARDFNFKFKCRSLNTVNAWRVTNGYL